MKKPTADSAEKLSYYENHAAALIIEIIQTAKSGKGYRHMLPPLKRALDAAPRVKASVADSLKHLTADFKG